MKYLPTTLIALAVFLSPLAAGRNTPTGTSAVAILVCAGFVAVLWDAKRSGQTLPAPAAGLALTGFVVMSLLSLLRTESFGASLAQVSIFFVYALIYFGGPIGLRDRPSRLILLGALAASGAAVSVVAVREYTLYSPGGDWRVFGPFISPGFLGGFLTVVIPVTLGLLLAARERTLVMAAGGAVVLELVALLLTGTRFAVFATSGALAVLLGLAALVRALDRTRLLRLVVLLIISIPLAVGASKPMRSRVAEGATQAHSGSFRVVTWKATADMASAHPALGTGPGTFEIAFPRYALAGYTRQAHQGYLQVAAECGIPAAVLLLLALALGLIGPAMSAFKHQQTGKSTEPPAGVSDLPERLVPASADRLLLISCIGSMAGFLARNLLDSDIYIVGVALPVFAAAALAASFAGLKARQLTLRSAHAAALMGLAAIVCVPQILSAAADLQMDQAMNQLQQGDGTSADKSSLDAVKLNPWNAGYHLRRSWILASDPGRLPEAESEVRQAISLEPTRAKYHYNLGRLLEMQGRVPSAIDEYEKARSLDRHSPQLMLATARAYDKLGRKKEALDTYRSLAELEKTPYATLTGVPELVEPSYAFAHQALGNDLLSKDPQAAIEQYLMVLRRLDDRDKHTEYIQAMIAAGTADAESERKLLDLREEAYTKLAEAYRRTGRPDREQTYLDLAEKTRKRIEDQGE